MTLRARRDGDVPALLASWRAAVEATHHFLTPADIDWYSDLVAGYLPKLNDLRVAVDSADRPFGFIAQDDGEIHMLFVDPAAHGHGIGTLLLEDEARDFPTLPKINKAVPSPSSTSAATHRLLRSISTVLVRHAARQCSEGRPATSKIQQ